MGKVVSLKPYVKPLPPTLPERAPRRVPLGTTVKAVCDQLYSSNEFRKWLEGISPETSITGSLAYDGHNAILMVIEVLKKSNPDMLKAIPQVEMKIGVAIRDWMKETGISRRARRLIAREDALRDAQDRVAKAAVAE